MWSKIQQQTSEGRSVLGLNSSESLTFYGLHYSALPRAPVNEWGGQWRRLAQRLTRFSNLQPYNPSGKNCDQLGVTFAESMTVQPHWEVRFGRMNVTWWKCSLCTYSDQSKGSPSTERCTQRGSDFTDSAHQSWFFLNLRLAFYVIEVWKETNYILFSLVWMFFSQAGCIDISWFGGFLSTTYDVKKIQQEYWKSDTHA